MTEAFIHAKPLSLISTAIPYVNAEPHLGLKNARAAAALGVPTRQLVDANARQFHALGEILALDWDAFVRTSGNPAHRAAVERIWDRMVARCAHAWHQAGARAAPVPEARYGNSTLIRKSKPVHRGRVLGATGRSVY